LGETKILTREIAVENPLNAPPLAAFSDATSIFSGNTIRFFAVSSSTRQFTVVIQLTGTGPVLFSMTGYTQSWTPGSPANIYAVGYPLSSPSVLVTIPSNWTSGLYVATFTDIADPTKQSQVPFIVKASGNPTPPVLIVIPYATHAAYNGWGGASLYNTDDPGDSGPYIQPLDGTANSHSYQVSFSRPWVGWTASPSPNNYFPFDYKRYSSPIAFLESVVGASSIGYASSIDLHFGTVLINNYNLMISIGHDEYWSWQMRDTVEEFIRQGGNVCFFTGNTCWWQVRFESRATDGSLVSANDPRTMVSYKLGSVLPVSAQPDYSSAQYNFSRDPGYLPTIETIYTTTNWWSTPVARPENYMTGLSYRNGAYTNNATTCDFGGMDPSQVGFTPQFPEHWVYGDTPPPSLFGNSFMSLAGIEMDGAVLQATNAGLVTTGEDGTPENFTVLASCDVRNWLGINGSPRQGGYVTMGLYRNNGVVFNAGVLGWDAALQSDATASNVTTNVLNRLKQRGPWKYEQLLQSGPRKGQPQRGYYLRNSYFESWTNGALDNWIVECPQYPPASQWVWEGDIGPSGNHSLIVDGKGQVWITQDQSEGYVLQCERYTNYRVGVLVYATAVGAVSICLQDQNGYQFAIARNQTANKWEDLSAIAQNNIAGPFFGAHVVIVVNEGNWAMLSDVSVFEYPTPGTWLNGFNGPVTK
jgi:hypothetical protein